MLPYVFAFIRALAITLSVVCAYRALCVSIEMQRASIIHAKNEPKISLKRGI